MFFSSVAGKCGVINDKLRNFWKIFEYNLCTVFRISNACISKIFQEPNLNYELFYGRQVTNELVHLVVDAYI